MRRVPALLALSLMTFACACGGAKHTSEPVAEKQFVDGPPPPDAAPAAGAQLSQDECTRLFDHIAELAKAGMPPNEWADSKDDLAAGRDGMIKDCHENGETTRVQYECLMRTQVWAKVTDCVPAK